MPYYLTDKAYHKCPVFLYCCANPTTRKQRVFNRLQEAVRKDVERLYGILASRFHMLLRPSRFTTVPQMVKAVKAMAILHNNIVVHRRGDLLENRRISAAAAARNEDTEAELTGTGGCDPPGAPPGNCGIGGRGAVAVSGSNRHGDCPAAQTGVADASSPFAPSAAAGSDDPAGRGSGGGGRRALVHTHLDPLPGGLMPDVRVGVDPPPGSFLFFLEARAALKDEDEFIALRNDLFIVSEESI